MLAKVYREWAQKKKGKKGPMKRSHRTKGKILRSNLNEKCRDYFNVVSIIV